MSITIDDIDRRLQCRFRSDVGTALTRTYQFRIADEDHFHIRIVEGVLSVHRGTHGAPCVTMLFPDVETALGLLEGSIDPMQAFLDGQIRSDGNLILALQLGGLFRP